MYRKLFTALALVAVVAGCEQGPSGPQQTGTFSVLLTDAPGDFAKAVVTIDQVYLQAGEGEGEGPGRVVLMSTPTTVDLLELRNVATDLVRDATVAGGTYSQLRLVISGGYIEVEQADGSTRIYASSPAYAAAQGVTANGGLQMPSFAQSGLKINLPGGAVKVDGDHQILLLDFNVAESFGKQAGQSGQWVMTPVIHASDLSLTSAVEYSLSTAEGVTLPTVGEKQLTLADFQAMLDKNGDVLVENFRDVNGVFKVTFRFLMPGTYPVSFLNPDGLKVNLNADFPTSVTTTSGGTFRQAFTITQAVLE
jgi:hypothetical protein